MSEINRSVVWIRDEDTQEDINANDILSNVDESIAIRMREALVIAQKSGNSKYVCAYCGNPLSLRHRNNWYGETWFFAHFPSDDPCPQKEETEYSPRQHVEFQESRFRESTLHKQMMLNMTNVLRQDSTFTDIRMKQRLAKPEILPKEFRIPDACSLRKGKEIAFDFLLYTTLIGTIVDRNVFYRTIGTYMMWLFPYFDEKAQRMCEKDIFYTHRRNVFVFDARNFYRWDEKQRGKPIMPPYENRNIFAYEESIARKCLCLKCYWQEPVVEDNTIRTKWHHKLVTLDELTFDEESKEVYYIDSDSLFYEKADTATKTLYDEWFATKEMRWREYFDEIRAGRTSNINVDTEQIQKFQDDTRKWGYKYKENKFIPAIYYDAFNFAPSGLAFVRKIRYWGIIDLNGQRIHDFNIKNVSEVENGGYYVDGQYYNSRLRRLISKKHDRFFHQGECTEASMHSYSCQGLPIELPEGFTICKYGESDIYDKHGRMIAEGCVAYKACDYNHTIVVYREEHWGHAISYYYGLYNAKQQANIISEHTTQYRHDSLTGIHNFILPNDNQQEEYKDSYDEHFEYIIQFIPLSPNLYKGRYKKKWRLYDKNHQEVIDEEFNDICQVADIVVCNTKDCCSDNSYSLYATDGQLLTDETFSEYKDKDGILYVLHEGEMYPYIKGKGLMPLQEVLCENLCSLKFEGKYALGIGGQRVTKYKYSQVEYLDKGLISVIAYETELYGLFNNKGKQILPCEYKKVKIIGCNISVDGKLLLHGTPVNELVLFAQKPKDNEWDIYSPKGKLYRTDTFCDIDTSKDILHVDINMDAPSYLWKKDTLLQPYSIFNGILPIRNCITTGVYTLKMGNLYAIKIVGKRATDYMFSYIENLENGLFLVNLPGKNLYGVIDRDGRQVIPCAYRIIQKVACDIGTNGELLLGDSPTDCVLFTRKPNDDIWYAFNSAGKMCRADHYDNINTNGKRLHVKIDEDLYNYSITQGILPLQTKVSEHLSILKIGKKYALSNNIGLTTEYKYDTAKPAGDRFAIVSIKEENEKLYGVYADGCTEFLPCVYPAIRYYGKGGFATENPQSHKWNIINEETNTILPDEYDEIRYSPELDFYLIKEDEAYKMVDRENHVVTEYPSGLRPCIVNANGITIVKKSNKELGLCDANGEIIVEPKYAKITHLKNGRYILFCHKIEEGNPFASINAWITKKKEAKLEPNDLISIHDGQAVSESISKDELEKLAFSSQYRIGQEMEARVINNSKYGLFVRFPDGQTSLLYENYLKQKGINKDKVSMGTTYKVAITKIIPEKKQVRIKLI